jgi:hypothetical protein
MPILRVQLLIELSNILLDLNLIGGCSTIDDKMTNGISIPIRICYSMEKRRILVPLFQP